MPRLSRFAVTLASGLVLAGCGNGPEEYGDLAQATPQDNGPSQQGMPPQDPGQTEQGMPEQWPDPGADGMPPQPDGIPDPGTGNADDNPYGDYGDSDDEDDDEDTNNVPGSTW